MSPRAACRLELMGFTDVYDYVPGKSAWLAGNLPAEGETVPLFVVHRVRDVPTCRPGETPSEHGPVVEVADDGTVLALWDGGERDVGPHTIRPHTLVDEIVHELAHEEPGYLLVTTLGGRLLGILRREDVIAE